MYTNNEITIIKIDMELLHQLIKSEGFTIGEFMEDLGYTVRTWYYWKSQGGISPTAFIKLGIMFDWFDVPEKLNFTLVTNRQ